MLRPYLLALLFLSLSISSLKAAESSTYYIPPNQMSVALEVMDMGFANVFALFRSATGSFSYDEETKTISNLKIAIDMTSLLAANNENQRDLSNMLTTFQYPELRITDPDPVAFTDNKAEMKANLSFHGVNKPITITATLNRSGKSEKAGGLWTSEGNVVGVSMTGEFKKAEYGIVDPPDVPGRFGDTITLRLEAAALKQ